MMKLRKDGAKFLASGAAMLIVEVALISSPARAENALSGAGRDGAIQLEPILIEGDPIAPLSLPALPSELDVEGPFGGSRSVLDTPRAVTPISTDLI